MPIMLISWQACLGRGTSKSVQKDESLQAAEMKLNFLGNVEETRCLAFAALKETYVEDWGLLSDAMEAVAKNLHKCMVDGVSVSYGLRKFQLHLAAVAVKGDWPWLIAAGGLTRHFRHAPKQAASGLKLAGICHFCLAGQNGYPFSDVGNDPTFEATMGSAASDFFFESPTPFTSWLPADQDNLAWLYRPDMWHNYHLGHGRYFLASAMVLILPLFGESLSVVDQFQSLSDDWRAYYRARKERPNLARITRDTCGFQGNLDWPEGGWQKASTTALLSAPWCHACVVSLLFASISGVGGLAPCRNGWNNS